MNLRGLELVIFIFAAASPVWANVRVAVPGGPSAPSPPLRHALMLRSPSWTLDAGSAFLRDPAAQLWFQNNRPEQFPELLRTALSISDWEQVLTSYDDSRLLREAILSRQDSEIAQKPSVLLELVDRTPALADKRRLYEEAVLDWPTLFPEIRMMLGENGTSETLWESLPILKRYETVRRASQKLMQTNVTVGPWHPEFIAQYERALLNYGGTMMDDEISAALKVLARANRMAKSHRRLKNATQTSSEQTASALLDSVRDTAILAEEKAPGDDLFSQETKTLQDRLIPKIYGLIRGTPFGRELLATLSDTGFKATIGKTEIYLAAHYEHQSKLMVIGDRILAQMMFELGYSPRDLLTNDEALADVAVLYSGIVVHEISHHLQYRWVDKRIPARAQPLVYNHLFEVEANAVHVRFLKEQRAADPDFAKREARLRDLPGLVGNTMSLAERVASDPVAMRNWLTYNYRTVPTFALSGARMIDLGVGLKRSLKTNSSLNDINVELARRRRLTGIERLELERLYLQNGDFVNIKEIATGELRRLRSRMDSQVKIMMQAFSALSKRFGHNP